MWYRSDWKSNFFFSRYLKKKCFARLCLYLHSVAQLFYDAHVVVYRSDSLLAIFNTLFWGYANFRMIWNGRRRLLSAQSINSKSFSSGKNCTKVERLEQVEFKTKPSCKFQRFIEPVIGHKEKISCLAKQHGILWGILQEARWGLGVSCKVDE